MAKKPEDVRDEGDTGKMFDNDIHQWQIDHIREGIRDANAARFAPAAEVKRVIGLLRRK